MNALFVAAKEICDFMMAQKWNFCIIGGLAVQRWGEPRGTLDVDITVLAGLNDEKRFVKALLGAFKPRISNAENFALTNRVILLYASNNIPVDISLGCLPFEKNMMRRVVKHEFARGLRLPVCTAEDLFVMKVFAARQKDWHDAESIAIRQEGRLNTKYILKHLKTLCGFKGTPELVQQAKKVLMQR